MVRKPLFQKQQIRKKHNIVWSQAVKGKYPWGAKTQMTADLNTISLRKPKSRYRVINYALFSVGRRVACCFSTSEHLPHSTFIWARKIHLKSTTLDHAHQTRTSAHREYSTMTPEDGQMRALACSFMALLRLLLKITV